jgi:hypothetical protein
MKDLLGAIIGGVIIALLVNVFCSMVGIAIYSWIWWALIIGGNAVTSYLSIYITKG